MSAADHTDVPDYPGRLHFGGAGALVVGAGQGIGRQTAHALAASGARVACVDYVADLAHQVADDVGGVALVGDARDRADVERIVTDAAASLDGVRVVVDIVGMARYAQLAHTTDEDWDWTFGMVLRHAFLLAQTAGAAMTDGGSMVFVASVSGLTSAPFHAAYGAAKAGLMSLVRSAAVELGPAGVRVNAVAPGVVWTPRVSAMLGEDGRRIQSANAPLGRVAEPADIAGAVLFLASDLAGYVNGHTLVVDGGVGVKFPYPMGGVSP